MSGLFDEPAKVPRPAPRASGRSRALLITAGVLVVGFMGLTALSSFWTERLWFGDVGYASVFSRLLWTKVALFFVFGALMTLSVGASMLLAYRMRPVFRPASAEQTSLARYREAVTPIRRWLLLGISLLMGAFAGSSASGQWRNFMLWRHGVPFGRQDPYFHRDIGFYVFDLAWWHFLVDFTMALAVVALLAAAVVHYLYGGIRLQGTRDRLSGAAAAQLSVLVGIFMLAKGADYWLDRFDILNGSGSLIDGMTFTDDHAVLPAKNILLGIAVITALLFFLNVWRRTWMLPSVGLGLFLLSAILLGMIWPGIVQQLQVNPSEPNKEAPYIERNIEATRAAFALEDIAVEPYQPAVANPSATQLAAATSSVPLVDPQLVQQTFEQKQQVRGFYSVAPVLDVDRYKIDGTERALVLGVRELDQNGLAEGNKNWSNLHTVYTHGFGVIAAYGNQRNKADQLVPGDATLWSEGYLPPRGDLTDLGYQPRIYFGEQSPSYSIVGKTASESSVEFDQPDSTTPGSEQGSTTTYDGKAGVGVGGLWHKLLYAVKFGDANILLSSRVNENSRIIYDRTPAQRVEKVAPWLSVDGDPYPAVVDGKVVWILDGYTTTDRYPQSEKESFKTMTDDSLAAPTGFQAVPTDEVNYMRNAVKATVDAYDGTVTLYAWDETDPMLKAWMGAFPGTVQPKSEMSTDLLAHVRYPEDLFKVQRYQFARYHVTDSSDFYEGNDRWVVPRDPNPASDKLQPPYRMFVDVPATDTGTDTGSTYSLTSVYVPNKRENLAAFMAVDSDATDPAEYGKIRVLRSPADNTPGPGQVANTFSNDQDVRDALFTFNSNGTKPVYGNLLTLPVADKLLYVQPLYTVLNTEASYPILKYVIVSFGGDEVGFATTLPAAVRDLLGETAAPPVGNSGSPGTGTLSAQVSNLLNQADVAFKAADEAQKAGDTVLWAQKLQEGRDLIEAAIAAANPGSSPTGSPSSSASPSASGSPSP